jgi:hypothetical protein
MRLEGRRANPTLPLIMMLVLIAAVLLALEYAGAINLIAGFGPL